MNEIKTKSLIRLLVIVILGYLGIHKFLERNTKLGWVYLFTLGLFGIGWIIDIIVALKDYTSIVDKDNSDFTKSNTETITTPNIYRHIFDYKKLSLNEIVEKDVNEYVVFDTETTGLYPENGCRVIEFCLLKYKDGVLVDKLTSLINPDSILPARVTEITGITNDDVKEQPFMNTYINQIIDFIGSNIVIGHNISFDLNFLKSEINRCQFETKELYVNCIDTLDMVKKTIYDVENNKLETLKEYFGIQTSSHRALADCETTSEVYIRCLEILKDKKAREIKMAENYKKREEERLATMSDDEKEIINHFIETAKRHDKEIEYSFKSDKSISFTLRGIEIGKIKFNGRKRFCKLFAGDFKDHEWENVENPEKSKIFEYIEDLFIYVDKEYKRYFLEYGD